MPRECKLIKGVDYSHLSEKEMNTKGFRELYSIFYLNKNCGLNDTEIGLKAREMGLTGYDGITLCDIVRGNIYRWNTLFPKSEPRVIRKPRILGESKGRYYIEPNFAKKVFGHLPKEIDTYPPSGTFDILAFLDGKNSRDVCSFEQFSTPNLSFKEESILNSIESPIDLEMDDFFNFPNTSEEISEDVSESVCDVEQDTIFVLDDFLNF